jgi:hypothetical protein
MAQYSQNPYSVQAGNDYSAGLSGLSNTISNVRQDRLAQAQQQMKQDQIDRAQKRFEEVQGAAQEAFASQDPDKVAALSVKYPEITPWLKDAAGLKDDMQNKDALSFTRQFATATDAERPGLYEQRIKQIQDRGGDPAHTIQSYQDYQQNPEAETRDVLSYWAGIDPKGYKSFSDDRAAQQKQQNSDRGFGLKEKELGQQMTIAQMNSGDRALDRQIALLNAQQASTMNDLKRQEIQQKIDTKTQAQQQLQQTKQQAADGAAATFDQASGTVKQLLNHPGFDKAVGRASIFPTVPGGDAADFEALLDTFKAQTFLPQVAALRGTGALSDAEGKKLTDAVGAVSVKMSPGALRKSLTQIDGTLAQAKARALKGLPQSQSTSAVSGTPSVTTQAQFDALPSGSVYLEDGVQYRKP